MKTMTGNVIFEIDVRMYAVLSKAKNTLLNGELVGSRDL